jgi:hypothetical protein
MKKWYRGFDRSQNLAKLEYSPKDRLADWQEGMLEYQQLGTPLGLLMNIWERLGELSTGKRA